MPSCTYSYWALTIIMITIIISFVKNKREHVTSVRSTLTLLATFNVPDNSVKINRLQNKGRLITASRTKLKQIIHVLIRELIPVKFEPWNPTTMHMLTLASLASHISFCGVPQSKCRSMLNKTAAQLNAKHREYCHRHCRHFCKSIFHSDFHL